MGKKLTNEQLAMFAKAEDLGTRRGACLFAHGKYSDELEGELEHLLEQSSELDLETAVEDADAAEYERLSLSERTDDGVAFDDNDTVVDDDREDFHSDG